MSTIIYGLKNCDTCRKAKKWLAEQGVDHRLHDVRADGLDRATVASWAGALGWDNLLNKRGTTWRGLDDAIKESVDEAKAIDLMAEHPALIKRPVFDHGGSLGLGFPALQKAVAG